MTITTYFKKIIKRQTEIGYSFPKSLNHSADEKQIKEVENSLGFQFNDALRQLYLFANGSQTKTDMNVDDCLIPLHRFLSLSDAIVYYDNNIKNDFVFAELFGNWITNDKPGKKLFPFLADDLHCFWVDLNDTTENYGRIYVAFSGGESPEYQFNSLTILFQIILECYRKGIYYLDKEYDVLLCNFIKYGELCQKFNPDIKYWKIVTDIWKQHLAGE